MPPDRDDPRATSLGLARLSDAALMQRVAGMDADAFAIIYDRHARAAYATAYHVIGARMSVDEVCQEAFLSIWRSAGSFDARLGSARAWILAVVRNRAIDCLRRRLRISEREVQDEALANRHPAPRHRGTESCALRNAAAGEVRRALADLPDSQRRVIELSFFSGYCHREIAELLELPLGTVKTRSSRGLTRLRVALSSAQPLGPPARDRSLA